MDIKEYHNQNPELNWFTFIIPIDLNLGTGKGSSSLEVTVYRSGRDYAEASKKIIEDFINPYVYGAFSGRLEPIRGTLIGSIPLPKETPYKIEER